MNAVSIAEAWPAAGRPFTVAELDRMPEDGRRYELLEGVLVVSPRPTLELQVGRRSRPPAPPGAETGRVARRAERRGSR